MDAFISTILLWAANFAPRGWSFCNGQILPISQNTALFSLLGTTYGGDGITTFSLPNFGSRFPVGTGTGPGLSNYQLGQIGGGENVTLTNNQLPPHTHAATGLIANVPGTSGKSSANTPTTSTILASAENNIFSTATANVSMPGQISGQVALAGGGQPTPILPPYLAINMIIALVGIFPSRN